MTKENNLYACWNVDSKKKIPTHWRFGRILVIKVCKIAVVSNCAIEKSTLGNSIGFPSLISYLKK